MGLVTLGLTLRDVEVRMVLLQQNCSVNAVIVFTYSECFGKLDEAWSSLVSTPD